MRDQKGSSYGQPAWAGSSTRQTCHTGCFSDLHSTYLRILYRLETPNPINATPTTCALEYFSLCLNSDNRPYGNKGTLVSWISGAWQNCLPKSQENWAGNGVAALSWCQWTIFTSSFGSSNDAPRSTCIALLGRDSQAFGCPPHMVTGISMSLRNILTQDSSHEKPPRYSPLRDFL